MITSTSSHPAPAKWPFPPVPVKSEIGGLGDNLRNKSFAGPRMRSSIGAASPFGVKRMLGDVMLVAVWGAMIPGLLWLGNAAGF